MKPILVVGDYMLDRYLLATLRGPSPEQVNCNVYTVHKSIEHPGGAGNVVVNLTALDAPVMAAERAPFPVKNRLFVDGKMVARFDQQDRCVPVDLTHLQRCLGLAGAVIVSDYGKGAVTDHVRELVLGSKLMLFVDTKGDPDMWEGENVTFFPNSSEFEAFEAGYRRASQVVLKRSAQGIARLTKGVTREYYAAMAKPHTVKDVCGAGDTVIAAYASALMQPRASCTPLLYANAAASIVVRRPYTSTTSHDEIIALLNDFPVQSLYREAC